MSYELAMEKAGARIDIFKNFGSYQGEWWTKVFYNNSLGWVNGSYGSCSGCDAFYGEFNYEHHTCYEDVYYSPIYNNDFRDDCIKCQEIKVRLIAFGKNYLDDIMTQEQAESSASRNLSWDYDAAEMLQFIKNNKINECN